MPDRALSRLCLRIANLEMLGGTVQKQCYGSTRSGIGVMSSHAMLPDACSLQQRRAMTLTEPRFPILTLEEVSLTPAPGYLFDRKWLYPYESLISILWKFEKANALSGNIVARLLGPDVDPSKGPVPPRDSIDI